MKILIDIIFFFIYKMNLSLWVQNKVPSDRYGSRKFVIAYGPPASGKGSIFNNLQNQLNVTAANIIEINVDKIIEANPHYQREITKCQHQFSQSNSYEDIDPEYIQACNLIYWQYRKQADQISTQLLKYALSHNFDVVYEMTGNNIQWFMQHDYPLIPPTYEIEIIYIVVKNDLLLNRAFTRAKYTGRLPQRQIILDIAKHAEENFIQLASNPTFTISIIDNNGNPRLLFHKSKNKVICHLDTTDLDFLPKLKQFMHDNFCSHHHNIQCYDSSHKPLKFNTQCPHLNQMTTPIQREQFQTDY